MSMAVAPDPVSSAWPADLSFHTQPQLFLRMVELRFRQVSATEHPPQSVQDGLCVIHDPLTNLECNIDDGDTTSAMLQNLVEVAARALETAHAVLMGAINDDVLWALLHQAYEEAIQAEALDHARQEAAPQR